jgi:hypothetical protein
VVNNNTLHLRKFLKDTLTPIDVPQESKQKMNIKFEEAKLIYMNKTFSVSFGHVQMVREMAEELTAREGKIISDGEVVRRAIDLLYASTFGEPTPELTLG